ncbi:MAG: FtsH protease activity modulator HflK [Rhodothalassiaceae bacterium]
MPWHNHSDGSRNPWDQGGRGDNPWRSGGGPRRGGPSGGGPPQGPDFDDLIRRAQERLKRGLPGGLGGGRGLLILALVFVGLWLASGFYTVRPGYQGVVTTFGDYTSTAFEGLNYHLPWPIQSVEKVSVEQIYETKVEGSGRSRRNADSTLMLTGDENIVDIAFTVFWKIAEPQKYLFNIEAPQEETVKVASESALRDVIGRTTLQNALTTGKGAIQAETEQLLQALLESYGAGISVEEVQLLEVDPPAQVIEAFRDVQAAEADRERIRNEAERYRNQVVPEARGQAQRMIQEAEAYKRQVVARAEGEAARFLSVFEEYRKAQDVTKKRLYLETMEEILTGMDKIILDDKAGQGVVPYLPLDQVRQPSRSGGTQ